MMINRARYGAAAGDARCSAGFTLIELLVVLVILGLLAGLVGPQVLRYLGGARSDTAALQIEELGGGLDLFHLEVGRYPTTEEGLVALVSEPPGVAVVTLSVLVTTRSVATSMAILNALSLFSPTRYTLLPEAFTDRPCAPSSGLPTPSPVELMIWVIAPPGVIRKTLSLSRPET